MAGGGGLRSEQYVCMRAPHPDKSGVAMLCVAWCSPGTTSTPRCFLQDATGQKYCGLPCHVKTSQKCSSDEHMVCQTEGAGGICGYAS